MARRKAARVESTDVFEHTPATRSPEAQTPVKFKPRTAAQEAAWDLIDSNDVVFLLGAAGTGKTQLATAWANIATSQRKYKRVIHTRPVVEAFESLGWLPGTVDEKLAPYMRPLSDCSSKTKLNVEISTIPLAYMRGLTLEDAVCILDEAQNANYAQLKLYVTRFGYGSKMIICGDQDQIDIRDSGLMRVHDALAGLPGVASYFFKPEDSVRHPLVCQMLHRL